jgi:hypothetical protein
MMAIQFTTTSSQETPVTDTIQAVPDDSDPDIPFQDEELNDL